MAAVIDSPPRASPVPRDLTAGDILFRDERVVVVDKPAGMLVHRGWGRDGPIAMTRVRDLVGRWVYPVHRLDRGASGALVMALSPVIARELGAAFASRRVRKTYAALVRGVPDERGWIDHALSRDRRREPPKPALTAFRRVAVAGRYALVMARPVTGRTHQIRRHFKHISCPLIGDVKYGKGEHNRLFRDEYALHRLALHALWIGLPAFGGGDAVEVAAPLAPDLARTLDALGIGDAAALLRDGHDDWPRAD